MTAVRVIESSGSIGVLQSANAFGGFEPTNILFSTGSGLIEGSLKLGTDTALLISGSKDSIGTSTVGVTVFTGDVVISGTLAGGSPLKIAGGMEVTGTMEMKPAAGGSTSIIQNPVGDLKVYARENLKLGSGDGEITLIDLSGGTCGSIQLVGDDVGALKTVSFGTPGTLFFTGSGSGHYFKGQASFDNGLSGSLTQLVDGTSYIKQSGNIAITSQSNGAITISTPNYVFSEYLGSANGTNTLFTLDKTPTASKNIAVFVNGMMQAPATSITSAPFQDYSVTGSSVFFTSSSIPEEGSLLFANYTTNDSTS